MIDKKQRSIIQRIQKKVRKGAWVCMCPECNQKAINTHLLQRKGILDKASSSHHYVEIKYKDVMYWFDNDDSFKYEKLGINQALSYPTFCNQHDTELFSVIEQPIIDLDDYRNQLLFSYRTLCSDLRKVEIVLSEWREFAKCEDLDIPYNKGTLEHVEKIINEGKKLRFFKEELESELAKPSNLYVFHHYTYPKVEIYASWSDGIETEFDLPYGVLTKTSLCFVHIIPQENSLEILIGYHKPNVCLKHLDYVNLWNNLDSESLGWLLTEAIANRTENIGISAELYERIQPLAKQRLCTYMSQNISSENIPPIGIDFNLFEGLIP